MCDKERGTCHGSCCCALPRVDTHRRTGRTTHAVKGAVMAASFGQRVVFMCGNQSSADDAMRIARDFLAASLTEQEYTRVSYSKDRITFYYSNGTIAGLLVFRSISSQCINIGLRTGEKFRVIEDHWATEVREEQEAKRIRMDDCATILRLMRKHGYSKLHVPDNENHVPTWVRK